MNLRLYPKRPTESIKDILRIMDFTLGPFTMLFAICVGVYEYQISQRLNSFFGIFSFLIFNLTISQISIRLKNSLNIEIFRQVFAICILCPFAIYIVEGPFSPFWYLYLIMIVSSNNIFFEVTGKHIYSGLITLLAVISYIASSYLLLDEPETSLIVIHSLTMIMLSLLFYRLLSLVDRTYRSEVNKSIALQETMDKLNSTKESLIYSSRLSAIGEMAGGIAHEINNPLTVIYGSIYQIKRLLDTGEMNKETYDIHIKRILDTIDRITRIISSLKVVSRESGEIKREVISLKDILVDSTAICGEKFRAHGINLKFDLEDKAFNVEVDADRVQISQVFINLLNNSYDAIETSESPWIDILVKEIEDFVLVSVIDSGPGIDTKLQRKIFEPFYTSKEVGKGTGLGLSISKGILEKHQGELFLDTNEKATCFVVKIPKAS
ncbi:GHKL domain protein [Bacteriovorax sp. BAL6_X]|uniref:sensor histidine kinase n=1 Tax=Bacteriovorax sp. BAL6_X TaxID=1201290 RepID=UPI0003863377|nr:ATP-binding protein [Bacteriovorax sp. BAL6_X]EPZ49494.1 GHKL domain protein [Bacteriovorax sp. BAL6_X]